MKSSAQSLIRTRSGLLAVLALSAAVSIAHAQSYTVVGLDGAFPGYLTSSTGINNVGQVAGNAMPIYGGTNVAVLYSGGVTSVLGSLNRGNSWAFGINDSGAVAGSSIAATGTEHAVLYSGGNHTDLGTLGGGFSRAYSINNSGQIVGYSSNASGVYDAFLYSGGVMVDLGNLGGAGSAAMGINNSGQIVGTTGTSGGQNVAFLYSAGVMVNLGTAGGVASDALAINNSGQVVGAIETSDNWLNAFLYSNGVMHNLGTLGGSNSQANGINDSGVIVGESAIADGNDVAFIYSNGVMTDLNSLVSLPNTTLGFGIAINNQGQIIAIGWDGQGYLLTPSLPPTPTPTPTPTPSPTPTPTPTPVASSARLINISVRAQVGTGGNILIPGFVIGGNGIETLLIRADGPALAQFGVVGVLAQPSLGVLDSAGQVVASNVGWSSNSNPEQITSVSTSVGAFALPSGSADCALIVSLPAGAYTVQISGANNTTGIALAEIYEVSWSGTRLVNLSSRAQVGTGANILIPGLVISGVGNERLLVRADGSGLAQFGVTNILAQPTLNVYNSAATLIASNTGWGTNPNPAQIASAAASAGAFALQPGSADSALIVNLSPGPYTMEISGVNNTTGVALAEVYEVPTPTPTPTP